MYLDENKVINKFLGTGENNKSGEDLITFINKYDPSKYKNPCNTVDTLIFEYNDKLEITKILLIKRANHPSIGWWAAPGGFVEFKEDIQKAALRELKEETGLDDIEVEQLKTYGDYDRDPRTRIITTVYVALVQENTQFASAGDDAAEALWFDIDDEIIEKKNNNGILCEKHRLCLENSEKCVKMETVVNITKKTDKILACTEYKVEKTNLLAADHGAIILEGYHYLNRKIAHYKLRKNDK